MRHETRRPGATARRAIFVARRRGPPQPRRPSRSCEAAILPKNRAKGTLSPMNAHDTGENRPPAEWPVWNGRRVDASGRYRHPVDWQAEFKPLSIPDMFDRGVALAGGEPVTDFFGKRTSYRDAMTAGAADCCGAAAFGHRQGRPGRPVPAQCPALSDRLLRHHDRGCDGGELLAALHGRGTVRAGRRFGRDDAVHGQFQRAFAHRDRGAGPVRGRTGWWSATCPA